MYNLKLFTKNVQELEVDNDIGMDFGHSKYTKAIL